MSSDRSGVLCPSPTVPERKNTELSLDSHRFGTVLRKQYARRFEEPTSSLGRSSARPENHYRGEAQSTSA
ncbi:hypothetical protein KL942_001273 [Ogataea angusta]|uniref:Uncharacterized protein n=1 Tax=Pichia angusta TaxID=870730 RepID=A0ABQ7S0Z7_PICAN|nr:hypothetical protein KL942_001273 [Ogataea angusta]KAG7851029.1 hypothetical protein KL940_001606 [Ogataea angusta]